MISTSLRDDWSVMVIIDCGKQDRCGMGKNSRNILVYIIWVQEATTILTLIDGQKQLTYLGQEQ
jgi:hypothetical protein